MSHRHAKQGESAGTARNEAQRRAHELKHDALLDRQTHFDKRCAIGRVACVGAGRARVFQTWIIDKNLNVEVLLAKDARPHGPARSDSPALLSRFGRARETREERTEITLSHLI